MPAQAGIRRPRRQPGAAGPRTPGILEPRRRVRCGDIGLLIVPCVTCSPAATPGTRRQVLRPLPGVLSGARHSGMPRPPAAAPRTSGPP
ncbi:MAG: hypothetical protein ACLTYN_09105 [Dysosmobacter welbionis]